MLESYPQWDQLTGITESSLQLVPVVVQDAATHQVLMLAWMNAEAFERTKATQQVTFYSRSRQTLWTKGATSGNVLDLVSMRVDCDRDTLLIQATPRGPVCHTGAATCFGPADKRPYLDALVQLIHERRQAMPPESYITHLSKKGIPYVGAKVMEEAEEVARAAREEGTQRTTEEAADVVFHLLVLLEVAGVRWADVMTELQARRSRPRRLLQGLASPPRRAKPVGSPPQRRCAAVQASRAPAVRPGAPWPRRRRLPFKVPRA